MHTFEFRFVSFSVHFLSCFSEKQIWLDRVLCKHILHKKVKTGFMHTQCDSVDLKNLHFCICGVHNCVFEIMVVQSITHAFHTEEKKVGYLYR